LSRGWALPSGVLGTARVDVQGVEGQEGRWTGAECPKLVLPTAPLSASFAYLVPDGDRHDDGRKKRDRDRAVEGKDHFP